MKKQKVISQMKGQDRPPEKQLNEGETGNLPEKRIQNNDSEDMIQDLGKTMEKMQTMFTKDRQELKNKQMNNTLEGIHSSITEAEQINDLEDRIVEITATEQHIKKRMKRNEDSLRGLCDNINCTNIRIIGVLEGEERKDLRKYLKRQ